jgi:5'-nucleotidase
MRVVYDKANREFKEFSLRGDPVEDERVYRIGLQHFHYMNVEDFFNIPLAELAKNGAPKVIATSCREILDEYLSNSQNLDRQVSGRLVVE